MCVRGVGPDYEGDWGRHPDTCESPPPSVCAYCHVPIRLPSLTLVFVCFVQEEAGEKRPVHHPGRCVCAAFVLRLRCICAVFV
jgi:hypothetical protein